MSNELDSDFINELMISNCISGGQKARITLARAVYSHAKILLLDDVSLEFNRVPAHGF